MYLQIYRYIFTPPKKKNNDIFYATDLSSSSSDSPVIRLMPNWSINFW